MPLTLFDRSLDQLDESNDRHLEERPFPVTHSQVRKAVSARRTSWGKKLLWAGVVGGLVAGVAYSRPWQQFVSKYAAAEQTAHHVVLKTVNIDHPAQAGASQVELPATIQPWQVTSLHARVSGYLKAWHKDLGTSVKTGELLAEIETPELDQELAVAKGQFLESTAATEQARAELVEAQSDLKVAEAQLTKVKAEAELAVTQLARREKLLKSKIIPQEEFDTFQKDLEARTAVVAATQSDLERRRANLKTRDAIISVRAATEKSRRSNVDRLNELQGFKRIVAPFDGVVTRRTAEVGMLVTSGKEPLYALEDLSRVRVQVNVPQTYAQQTRPGMEAKVDLPETTGHNVQAKITRTSETVDPVNRTMLAEIELENRSRQLQPGSYAKVTLTTVQNQRIWTIPSNTVAMRVEGTQVATVDGENRIQIRKVKLGRDLGSRVVVLEGIQGDEKLVVNPSDDLRTGLQIQIAPQPENSRIIAQR